MVTYETKTYTATYTYDNSLHMFTIASVKDSKSKVHCFKRLVNFCKAKNINSNVSAMINSLALDRAGICDNNFNNTTIYNNMYNLNIDFFECSLNCCKLVLSDCAKSESIIVNSDDNIQICNGNFYKICDKDVFDIKSKFVYFSDYESLKTSEIALDIETSKLETDTNSNCVSFSIADCNKNWAMTTTEINSNDVIIKCMLDFISSIAGGKKQKKIKCDVHNAKFDGSFILKYLIKNGYQQTNTNNMQDKQYDFIVNNNKLLLLTFVYKNVKITINDTFVLMSKPLAEISEEFAKNDNRVIAKNDTTYEYKKIRKIGEIYNQNEIVYCINDAVSTALIRKFFKKIVWSKVGLTASSTAMAEFLLSLRFGAFNTDNMILLLQCMISDNTLTSKNVKLYTKQNKNKEYIINDYYNENHNTHCTTFDDFKKYISTYSINYTKCVEFATTYCIYIDYLMNVRNWTFTYSLKFCARSVSKKQEIHKYKIKDEIESFYFPKNYSDDVFNTLCSENNISGDYFIAKQCDSFLRKNYYGGICAVNPDYVGIHQHNINAVGIDINSSYPHKLSEFAMPYGKFEFIIENTNNKLNEILNNIDYYTSEKVVLLRVRGYVKIKKGEISLFINKSFSGVGCGIYEDNIDRYITLNEYQTMQEIYDCTSISVLSIIMFNAKNNFFKAYYKRYYALKVSYKDTAFYEITKVLLNGLYGKFGENVFERNEKQTNLSIKDNNIVYTQELKEKYDIDLENINVRYLPIAIFTTSYARVQLISSAHEINKNGGEIIYTDTDSIYFKADNIVISNNLLKVNHKSTNIVIDKNKLGAWDLEKPAISEFIALAPKRYGLIDNVKGKVVKCAGIAKKYVNNFELQDLFYNSVHQTQQSQYSEYGVEISDTVKVLGYNRNIYMTDDNKSYQTEELLKTGDVVVTVYGETKTIKDTIYIKQ